MKWRWNSMGRSRKIYRKLVELEEVIPLIEKHVRLKPLGYEEVQLPKAVGRVLAEDIEAKINLPPFTRSLVDGYAVISTNVSEAYEDNPVRLKITGRIYAGSSEKIEINNGECVEVATGAPLPFPANAVVPVEYTHETGGEAEIYRRVAPGENVDQVASDIVRGEVIARKGEKVTPVLIAALAAAGINSVKVFRTVTVAVFSIGNELKPPGEKLEYAEVYDSNTYMVSALLYSAGANVVNMGIVKDIEQDIKERLDEALNWADIVVTIGGTSAGLEDLTYRILDSYNPGVIIHGLKVKPGGPTAIAVAGRKIIVALPGFPLSCLTAATHILLPIVRRLQGLREEPEEKIEAVLCTFTPGALGRKRLVPVIVAKRKSGNIAFPLPVHSGVIGRLPKLDGYIVVPENVEGLSEGTKVDVHLYPGAQISDVIFLGSHCPLVDRLLSEAGKIGYIKTVYAGSMAGLRAIKLGVADLAGIHLLDEESGEYNIPFIKRYDLKDVMVVRGYCREQGLIFRRGLDVKSIEDVIKHGLRFVNRNKGSGTRVLVDLMLGKIAGKLDLSLDEVKRQVRGYEFEVKTHEGVALLISQGLADVGVGIRYVAEKYGLCFHPISNEVYDFIVRKDALEKKPVKILLETLRDRKIVKYVKEMPGYRLHRETGKTIYQA
ncbi:MAG: molybdopterin biosynthesis protein [Thermoproteales archaeon]|nr:molybdopterin biosynthesis protein [Thermoproteales archaeon]